MRVAFLAVDIDLAGYTGDVSHVRDLATALAREGCDVDLVVANPSDWVPPDRIHLHSASPRGTLRTALALRRLFRSDPPAVIYERRESPKLSALLSVFLGRPYFVEINGLVDEEKAMQGRPDTDPGWVRLVRRGIRRRLLRGATGIVSVTDSLRKEVISRYGITPGRARTIPNGVDTETFHPTDKAEARGKLGLRGPGPFLIFVGNLVSWQGVDVLLRSLAEIRQSVPTLRLIIVGDGIERPTLEALVSRLGLEEAVLFRGRIPRAEVPIWISAADLAVMPSTRRRNERIGSSALKMREYLACGRPVVAANIEGGGPFLESRRAGIGFEPDDARDLAAKIITTLKDPARLEAQGRRGRELATAELTWSRSARALLELFRSGTQGANA